MQPLYRDLKKTTNLEAYVEWFNRLSYLVATEICVVSNPILVGLEQRPNMYLLIP